MQRKAIESGLPLADELDYAVCAREEVTNIPDNRDDIIVGTAADIFGTAGRSHEPVRDNEKQLPSGRPQLGRTLAAA